MVEVLLVMKLLENGILSISLWSSCSGHTPDMAVPQDIVSQASGIHLMGEDTKRKVPWLCSAKE